MYYYCDHAKPCRSLLALYNLYCRCYYFYIIPSHLVDSYLHQLFIGHDQQLSDHLLLKLVIVFTVKGGSVKLCCNWYQNSAVYICIVQANFQVCHNIIAVYKLVWSSKLWIEHQSNDLHLSNIDPSSALF